MRKLIFILCLTIAVIVHAKPPLSSEDRAVYDSLIATYKDLAPIAVLPPGWPTDIDSLGVEGEPNSPTTLRDFSYQALSRIDSNPRWNMITNVDRPLPSNSQATKLPTDVAYTDLDSGFVHIRWRQEATDVLAFDRIVEACNRAQSELCIILDLRKFNSTDIDSVLKALALFAPDTTPSLLEFQRIPGTPRDSTIKHSIPSIDGPIWKGPLLIVTFSDGWPTIVIKEVLKNRPYTGFYSETDRYFYFGYQYKDIELPDNYSCSVPTSVIANESGHIIRTGYRNYLGKIKCGNDLLGISINQTIREPYQELEDKISPIVAQYRMTELSMIGRIKWQIQDLWDSHLADTTPAEEFIE